MMEEKTIVRDYSLIGAESNTAVEKGLADAEWYQSPIPREKLRELLVRKNGPAIRDTIIWFGLIFVSAYLVFIWWGSWIVIFPYIIYSVLYASTSDSRWHESSHGTAFKTDWMNNVLYEISSFMVFRQSTVWRWSHTRHHSDTIIRGRDPEIAVPRPPQIRKFILTFFGIAAYYEMKKLLKHAFGRIDAEVATYVPAEEYGKVFFRARVYLSIFLIVIAVSIVFGSFLPLMYVGLPTFVGNWLMPIYGFTQHAGLQENVLDHRLNCRTVYMNRVNRFFYWNMNYHVEHHMFPLVPYHALPKLHELMKDDCPKPYNGIIEAFREIIPAILKQRKDPSYFVERKLSGTSAVKSSISKNKFVGHSEKLKDGKIEVCANSELLKGEVVRFDFDNRTYAVCRTLEDNLYATEGICTHGNAHLGDGVIIGDLIECPKHNGRFSLKDGSPRRAPVCLGINTYEVISRDEKIFMTIEPANEKVHDKELDFRVIGGFKDSRGEWRPENPVSYAPVFTWPPRVKKFFVWLFYYLFTWNLIYLAIVIFSYYFLQPPLEEMKTFNISWISTIFLRNMALIWIIAGGWHIYLYKFKARGTDAKYSPRWQSTNGSTFLWNDQVYDNVFWTCISAVPVWTAYEVLTFWLYANDKIPYLDFREHPVYFVLVFLLIPFWREFHFYLIHRLIHWKPLYDKVHYLHHYNINPGPWSGLAMHPVEHILYFSVVLIHYVVPSHPLHFLFNSQHTALTPAAGHSGFEGKVFKVLPFGSYFHYLHHRLFDCNYGESTIPMDKWFGFFEDGSQTQTEKQMAAAAWQKLIVTGIVDESPEVKSIYFRNVNDTNISKPVAGQHLTFKIPFHNKELCREADKPDGSQIRYALRNYTLSNGGENNEYRISVKKEPGGQVSQALHNSLKKGDILEAKGPKGSFVYKQIKGKPSVLIAAGIGITPILAMLKSIGKTSEEIHLILAVKERRLLCFADEINQVCKNNPAVKVHLFLSRDQMEGRADIPDSWQHHKKRVDIQSLKSLLQKGKHFNFFICGPEKMMESLVQEIGNWKGKSSPIHTETFKVSQAGQNQIDNKKVIQVHFIKSDKTIEWDHEFRNILEFAESNEIRMEAGCMFGECGACSTKVVSGNFEYNYETATKPVKGNCLPCSCHPVSDISLDA